MKESHRMTVEFYFRCLLLLCVCVGGVVWGGGVMAELFGFKQRTFLQHRRENQARINGRFNEHISKMDAIVGFGHTVISAIKLHLGHCRREALK